jgi:hypothetical protein
MASSVTDLIIGFLPIATLEYKCVYRVATMSIIILVARFHDAAKNCRWLYLTMYIGKYHATQCRMHRNAGRLYGTRVVRVTGTSSHGLNK